MDHTARQKQVSFIYHKILKIHPGAYIFQRPFLRGLYLEGPFNGGFFALLVWGTCITFGWAYFRNFTVYLYIFTSGHGCAQ